MLPIARRDLPSVKAVERRATGRGTPATEWLHPERHRLVRPTSLQCTAQSISLIGALRDVVQMDFTDHFRIVPCCRELMTGSSSESVELQVDYWLSGSSAIAAAAAARENNAASSTAGGSTTIGGLAATMAQAVSKSRGSGIGGGGASATGGDGKGSFQEPSSIKYTVKAGFRWIVVQRLPSSGSVITGSTAAPGSSSSADSSSLFTMTFGLKEKKQKSE